MFFEDVVCGCGGVEDDDVHAEDGEVGDGAVEEFVGRPGEPCAAGGDVEEVADERERGGAWREREGRGGAGAAEGGSEEEEEGEGESVESEPEQRHCGESHALLSTSLCTI